MEYVCMSVAGAGRRMRGGWWLERLEKGKNLKCFTILIKKLRDVIN